MISRCLKEPAPVTGLHDPTVAAWQVGDDADRTRPDFSQVAERPHLETATGRNGSGTVKGSAAPKGGTTSDPGRSRIGD